MNRLSLPIWRGVSFAAALAGTGIAAYLVRVHYDDSALICTVGDCATVQKSTYAELWGMPIALLGLGMYLAILALGVLRWRRKSVSGPATLTAFTIALAGTLYAAYLTYVELFVIDAICQWCVASALLTLVALAAESAGVWDWIAPVENAPTIEKSRAARPRASPAPAPAETRLPMGRRSSSS